MTETLRPDTPGLASAATLLAGGELVAFPTETVYGLGGDARSDMAVARIFEAKGRPRFNPLIVHVAVGSVNCNRRIKYNLLDTELGRRLAQVLSPEFVGQEVRVAVDAEVLVFSGQVYDPVAGELKQRRSDFFEVSNIAGNILRLARKFRWDQIQVDQRIIWQNRMEM